MLTLSTSNAEKILADRTSAFVKGYYDADFQATKIRAQILHLYENGTFPGSLEGVDIEYEHADGITFASYVCKVSDVQELLVKLKLTKAGDSVLEWKTGYSQDWTFDDSLEVWGGEFSETLELSGIPII
jgi:hypothetical protein